MILILAGERDEQATALAKRWGAAVVTPADLSRSGWRYELPGDEGTTAVVSGRVVHQSEVTGLLTRISCVEVGDLPGIATEDRVYVACEMHAFLVAWLDRFECPVLNRPTPGCLCGPSWRTPFSFEDADQGDTTVVVVGDRCFGAANASQSDQALAIAREAGVSLIAVYFRPGEVVHASLLPDLSREDVIAAVHELLTAAPDAGVAPRVPPLPLPSRNKSLILLWGLPADGPLGRVYEELLRLGAPVRLLDQRNVTDMEVCQGEVRVRGESFRLEDVASVYPRCYDSTQIPHVRDGPEKLRSHAAEVDARMTRWIGNTSALVVSPFDAMAANNSKPYQLRWIARFGWRIPETLITTDPAAARTFRKRHGDVIYKSISAVRSRVSGLTARHDPRLDEITACPVQFQEFIPGIDHRVHVVGEEVFVSRVLSDADDYRYAENGSEYVACHLSDEVEERCRRMSAAMRLPLSGIDLRLTPEGEWVCFEVNPSPGFTAYEDATGQPIAAAVARLLMIGL